MAIIELKPTSPGQRFKIKIKTEGLYKGAPVKSLTSKKNRTSGRNDIGRVTVDHRGGGHKRRLRHVDFKRNKDGIPARVERIEYDPNRSANIALLVYADGERRYIVAPKGIAVGAKVESGVSAPILVGNCLPLANMPVGATIHCIELRPGKGAQLARSAGAYAQLLAREGTYATVRLRSGEMRKIFAQCRAVIGEVGNEEHNLRVIGKAGAQRWRGIRPTVRGVAKNPVDHPLGGGEGRTSGGRPPCNKNGKPEGKKTRNRRKVSSRFIVRRRGQKKSERG
ncbi:MAG: 50S ribosomal protein L2 [Gammaproteobacteria bacterium 39-13]|nr:50S ribosomal protein L2 [Gammaproteobacteria bacterium]OJV92094.1 MAG: 50S ribosomal protein L2 [Gammaproteobacteria bacterium 39-13]